MTSWGTQTQTTWIPGAVDARPVLDKSKNAELWRVTASGRNVQLALSYGTCGTSEVRGIRLPFEAYLPGGFSLSAEPLSGAGAAVAPTLMLVSSAGSSTIRTVESGALDARVSRVVALTAATVTVDGNAIVLAAGASLDVVSPAVVTAGAVLADWTI